MLKNTTRKQPAKSPKWDIVKENDSSFDFERASGGQGKLWILKTLTRHDNHIATSSPYMPTVKDICKITRESSSMLLKND